MDAEKHKPIENLKNVSFLLYRTTLTLYDVRWTLHHQISYQCFHMTIVWPRQCYICCIYIHGVHSYYMVSRFKKPSVQLWKVFEFLFANWITDKSSWIKSLPDKISPTCKCGQNSACHVHTQTKSPTTHPNYSPSGIMILSVSILLL